MTLKGRFKVMQLSMAQLDLLNRGLPITWLGSVRLLPKVKGHPFGWSQNKSVCPRMCSMIPDHTTIGAARSPRFGERRCARILPIKSSVTGSPETSSGLPIQQIKLGPIDAEKAQKIRMKCRHLANGFMIPHDMVWQHGGDVVSCQTLRKLEAVAFDWGNSLLFLDCKDY